MLSGTAWRDAAGLACLCTLVHSLLLPQQQGELGPFVQGCQSAALDLARHAGRVSASDRSRHRCRGSSVTALCGVEQQKTVCSSGGVHGPGRAPRVIITI